MIQYRYRGFSDNTGQWAHGDLIHNQKVTVTGLEPRVMIGGYEVDPATVGISQIAWTYHKDNLRSEPRYLARNAASMKIVGNIHQNPELMHVDVKAGKR